MHFFCVILKKQNDFEVYYFGEFRNLRKKKKPFEMLTGEVSMMPTPKETRNFRRFVSVE